MISTRQRGSALIMSMIMIMTVMGMIAAVSIIANRAAYQRQEEVVFSEALEASEVGVGQALLESRGSSKVSGAELLGPIEQRPDYIRSNYHTWTRSGTANNINYTIQVKSAYWARHVAHPPTPTDPVGPESSSFLRFISKAEREDMDQPAFDIYQITTVTSDTGSNEFRRGVQTVVELRKANIGIPAALYIDNDPNPIWNGNSWRVNGADHTMEPSSPPPPGMHSSDDSLYLVPPASSPEHKPAVGYDGDYAELGLTAQEEDQITTIDATPAVVDGAAAFVNTKVQLRELAAAFVGGPASDPLVPDRAGIQNLNNMTSGTGAGSNGLGDLTTFGTTYINQNAGTVSGTVTGSGVLIIEGDVHISGQFTWYGLVIVLGNLSTSGGGSGIHIFGSMMVESESVISGNADIWWSSEAINRVMEDLKPQLSVTPLFKGWRVLDKNEIGLMGL